MKLLFSFCSLLLSLTLPAQAAVMLIYHHVASDTPRVSSVSADELRGHLQYFKDNNFQVIGLDLLIKQLREGTPVADNAVVITFDDSYENNFTTAHPILQQFGYPYTIFISPGSIDKGDGPLLNWQQVKQMSDDGVLVANHAMWHEHMAKPAADETEQQWLVRMQQSILAAEDKIEQVTGQRHQWLAYPYGEYSAPLEQLVSELGFIGIGVKPPMPEWGLLLSVARSYMPDFWWTAIFPGLAIFLAVFGFNLLGDGLRDVFDPDRGIIAFCHDQLFNLGNGLQLTW